jgi:hypothetical protein
VSGLRDSGKRGGDGWRCEVSARREIEHEAELFKPVLLAAMNYVQERGAVEFEPNDEAEAKMRYLSCERIV